MSTRMAPKNQPESVPSHIEVTAGVCGGKPRVSGTRIRVQDVVIWHERLNLSADEIVSKHPQLSLASVYSALAYYHDHREEINQQMAHGQTLVDELREKYPSKVQAKLDRPQQ